MNKKIIISLALVSVLIPVVTFAANRTFLELVTNVVMAGVLKPIVPLLVSLTIIVFIIGIIKFIRAADEKNREEGKQFMLWGVIGIFVMVSVWGLVGIIQRSFNLDNNTPINTNIDLHSISN